jgi:hypothetical protein
MYWQYRVRAGKAKRRNPDHSPQLPGPIGRLFSGFVELPEDRTHSFEKSAGPISRGNPARRPVEEQ